MIMKNFFNGYECSQCSKEGLHEYYACANCKDVKKDFCEDCIKTETICVKENHIIIFERKLFSFWSHILTKK